jgi:hypothetical protein
LTESYERDRARERVRFDVNPQGIVDGDDGDDGHLAATLRYVCRMGSQIGALLELGELERVSTLSTLALMARVDGVSPHVSIKAEVEMQGTKRPELVPAAGMNVQEAIDRALRRVTLDLATDWAAIITGESRLVGAVHDEWTGRGAPESVHEVGVRALAVLGALDESLRETAVRLDFRRGSVLVAAIGEHALYTHADKLDVSEVIRTVTAVQSLLAGADLARADLVTAFRRA